MIVKNNIKNIICILAIILPTLAISQTQLVLNNNVYINIENSAFLVIDRGNSNAITTSGTGGNIISESEMDVVKWNITDSIGNYTVPFATTPISQGGNGTKIPLTLDKVTSGSNDGSIMFST